MDDHELGSLLDTVAGAPPASDAALARIHHRAAQRMRRARIATAALVVAIVAGAGATAAALAGGNDAARRVPPAGPTSSSLKVATPGTTVAAGASTTSGPTSLTSAAPTTTVSPPVPGGECPPGSITLAIDPNWLGSAGARHWSVVATSHATVTCQFHGGFDASIQDDQGRYVAVAGNPVTQGGSGFPNLLPPNQPTNVASLGWSNPCSTGPVQLVVAFHDTRYGAGSPLSLPQQACANGPITTSHFQIEPAA